MSPFFLANITQGTAITHFTYTCLKLFEKRATSAVGRKPTFFHQNSLVFKGANVFFCLIEFKSLIFGLIKEKCIVSFIHFFHFERKSIKKDKSKICRYT